MKLNTLSKTALFGLMITLGVHLVDFLFFHPDLSASWPSWLGVYCAWLGLLIGGIGQQRRNRCHL